MLVRILSMMEDAIAETISHSEQRPIKLGVPKSARPMS